MLPPSDDALSVENPFFRVFDAPYAALQVTDDSIAPLAYADSFLITAATDAAASTETDGRPCLCELADGRRLIRIVSIGAVADRRNLLPINMYTPAIADAELIAVRPVLVSLPQDIAAATPTPTHPGTDTVQERKSSYRATRRKKA